MEDYPRNLLEFEDRFATQEACREYLCAIRWPEGFQCPRCGSRRAWRMSRGVYWCQSCDYQVSVTAGTIFQDTHKSLRLWFRAMWYVTDQKHGVSALGLQKSLGFGSYRTAWTWLHKLRTAMVRPGRDRLLKRWLLGTHQGAIQPSHLDYYLDEFTFRFNRRTSRSRGKLFYRLVQQSVSVAPITGDEIRGGKSS